MKYSKTSRRGKKLQRKYRKKRYQKGAKKSSFVIVRDAIAGFPNRYFCKLKCVIPTIITTGLNHRYSFKANTLYNIGPSTDGGAYTGNFPAGINALFTANEQGAGNQSPYELYRVWGSKFTYYLTNQGGTTPPTRVVVFPHRIDNIGIGSSNYSLLCEQPYAHGKQFSGATTVEATRHSYYMATNKMFGVPKNMIYATEYSTGGNSQPTLNWVWNMYVFGDGTNNMVANFVVEIEYLVEFFGRTLQNSNAP